MKMLRYQMQLWHQILMSLGPTSMSSSSDSIWVDTSRVGSNSFRFELIATNLFTLSFVSLLRFLVCVFPNNDQLCSDAAEVNGIWSITDATGDTASELHSPFHQVAAETCSAETQTASPFQSPSFAQNLARLPNTLPLSRWRCCADADMTEYAPSICSSSRFAPWCSGCSMYTAACGFYAKFTPIVDEFSNGTLFWFE